MCVCVLQVYVLQSLNVRASGRGGSLMTGNATIRLAVATASVAL